MTINLTPVSNRKPKLCPIDPKNRIRFGEFVTIRKSDIYISDCLWEKMGYPDQIQFAIDETEKIIGIKKTDKDDPFGISIKMQAGGGVKGSGTSIIRDTIKPFLPFEIDFEEENVTFLRGFKADDFFCFRFLHTEKNPIKRRKKNI